MSRWPLLDARCSARQRSSSFTFTSEPHSSNSRATSTCPHRDAACNGMKPSSSQELMSEPRSIRKRAMSGFPLGQESANGGLLLPILSIETQRVQCRWLCHCVQIWCRCTKRRQSRCRQRDAARCHHGYTHPRKSTVPACVECTPPRECIHHH
jgi:hypothetical protein